MYIVHECFASEDPEVVICPSVKEVAERKVNEMMLYKTRGFYGDSAVRKVMCPINGRWRFTYTRTDDQDYSCSSTTSTAEDCPTGYKMEIRFRGCSFPDKEMVLQCLGNWRGEDGQNYLALLDTKLPQLGEKIKPRYSCAVSCFTSICS